MEFLTVKRKNKEQFYNHPSTVVNTFEIEGHHFAEGHINF